MNQLTNYSIRILLLMSIIIIFSSCQKNTTNIFNVKDFGAKGDNLTLDKKSIQQAIDAAYKNGGGTVLLPAPGKYLSGTIWLKDNITLEIEAGATLYGSSKLSDYDSLSRGKDTKDRNPYHLISVHNAKNVTIQGRGTIDGQGKNWYAYTDVKPRWMKEVKIRPSPMVSFENCQNIKVKDVLLTNAAGWTMHALDCDNIHVSGIQIINDIYAPNTDGFDMSGCKNVMISDCYIETCDDAICIKTHEDSRESSNITVTNCVIQTTCVALKFGEVSKDIRDVTFSNCVIKNSSRAFGIYATLGGNVENVTVSNIICNTNAPLVLNRPFQIAAWARQDPNGTISMKGGNVKNIIVSNFIGTTEGRILINAGDGCTIENITLRDIKLTYPYIEDPSFYGPNSISNQFRGLDSASISAKAALVVSNVNNLVVDGFDINWPTSDTIPAEWNHRERIENGKFDMVHTPNYTKSRNADFHAMYLTNVQGGYIFSPMASSSVKNLETIKLNQSKIRVMNTK